MWAATMVRVRTSISRHERQELILAEMRVGTNVRIGDLAARFGTSTETIRRDLDLLSQKGLINRTYGGGAPCLSLEPGMRERHRLMAVERRRIALAAAEAVGTGDVVMIDAGSSTLHLANVLAGLNRRIVAITNGLPIADALGKASQIRVVVCPGDLNAAQGAMVGPETTAFLSKLNADRAYFGASGLTADGPTEAESGMAWVKRAMIERAAEAVLLADHSKFDVRMLEVVCPLADLRRVVTDQPPPEGLAQALKRSGTDLTIAR
ncbi:DeoR/GlpR family DNA-binding transcription regulator [Phenylobacterium sp. CCH12-B4]|uniref:DeoR/GlpR family DNA-binding transcription regulator n=1 Tax=Phenylobacterium sp. CCH12-B4 TaxID=1768784 RepID=UPI0009ECA829|nr:DeoR/GlpR family DNA-binding transcription regulator [Phenylobacterium sp. CCH12-B4]